MSSRFLSPSTAALQPYVPGEQPADVQRYIKLNTNECPYPPSPAVRAALEAFDGEELRLYPDPNCAALTVALAGRHGLRADQAIACGGSDEALAFAFMAFCERGEKVYFPDITYGFYKIYAELFGLQAVELPLAEDFTVCPQDYAGLDGTIFLANPNAPTGIALQPGQVEDILRRNPDRVVVVDEAYADFAPGCSCIPLVGRYENLLVVQTFSKSRALAGMRLGAAYGDAGLIEGMNRIKFSFNPYNLDRVSLAVGLAAAGDKAYLDEVVAKVTATRERTAKGLRELGYTVLPSSTNFLFAAHPALPGDELYSRLRARDILVRYFGKPRIERYVRVSIGTDAEMDAFLKVAGELV